MDLFTILPWHIIAVLIGSIFTFLSVDPITILVRYVITGFVRDPVTFLVGFLDGLVLGDRVAVGLPKGLAGSWIIDPIFGTIGTLFPMLFAFSHLLIFAFFCLILLLDIFVQLIALLLPVGIALPFVICLALLFSVRIANPLELILTFLPVKNQQRIELTCLLELCLLRLNFVRFA